MQFNLSKFETQKELYNEPTDEELYHVDPISIGRRYLDSSTKQIILCDNLEDMIKKCLC